MAPRRKVVDEAAVVVPARVTRSAAARKASESGTQTQPEAKRLKTGEAKRKAVKFASPVKKEKKVEEANGNGVSEVADGEAEAATTTTTTKTIVIEHCKQCQSFKRRAEEAKAGLKKGISGISVVFNPDKPRRGCFEIREGGEGGEKFVTLLELKRPFRAMKDLDMDKVVGDIIDKIK